MGKMGTTKHYFFLNNNRHMVTMENQSFLPLVQFLIVFLYLKTNIFLLLYFFICCGHRVLDFVGSKWNKGK